MRYWSSTAMKDRSEAEELLARIHRQFADKSGFQWGVERKADGELLGTCTLFNIHRANLRGESATACTARIGARAIWARPWQRSSTMRSGS